MLAPSLPEHTPGLDTAYVLARWINERHARDGTIRYRASRVLAAETGLPTLAVEMSGPAGLIATYKCGVGPVGLGRNAWLVLAPLVVIWNGARFERRVSNGTRAVALDPLERSVFPRFLHSDIPWIDFDDDSARSRAMIDHLVGAVRGFRAASASSGGEAVIASGNLTKAKGGRPFFEGMGWKIVGPDDLSARQRPASQLSGRDDRDGEPMQSAVAAIRRRIDAAIAPLRDAGKVEAEPISFALLTLP